MDDVRKVLLQHSARVRRAQNSLRDELARINSLTDIEEVDRGNLRDDIFARSETLLETALNEAQNLIRDATEGKEGELSHSYYSNLIYHTYRDLIDRNVGYVDAIGRLEEKTRSVNNRLDLMSAVDSSSILKLMSKLDEVSTVQTLGYGLGLHPDYVDRIINRMIDKKF